MDGLWSANRRPTVGRPYSGIHISAEPTRLSVSITVHHALVTAFVAIASWCYTTDISLLARILDAIFAAQSRVPLDSVQS